MPARPQPQEDTKEQKIELSTIFQVADIEKSADLKPIVIGRFGGVFGIKGWVKAKSFTSPPESLFRYKPWLVQENNQWLELRATDHRQHKAGFTAQIAGIEYKEQARALVGHNIAVTRHRLPELPENSYYWHDLVGLEVITTQGVRLGRVRTLLDTNANHVLVVQAEQGTNKEYLIPWLPEQGVITKVALAEQKIEVDWNADF